jgi:hypothetical protein
MKKTAKSYTYKELAAELLKNPKIKKVYDKERAITKKLSKRQITTADKKVVDKMFKKVLGAKEGQLSYMETNIMVEFYDGLNRVMKKKKLNARILSKRTGLKLKDIENVLNYKYDMRVSDLIYVVLATGKNISLKLK